MSGVVMAPLVCGWCVVGVRVARSIKIVIEGRAPDPNPDPDRQPSSALNVYGLPPTILVSLYALFLTSLHLPSEQRPSANIEFAAITQHFLAQFARPFKGNAPLRFLRFTLGVQAYFDGSADRDLYFKGTPIVQSSGTGKTRMVLELANHAPLLYICLRAQGSTPLQGFPQSDVKPVNYFVNSLEKQTLNNKGKPSGIPMYCCDLQVAAFLGAWFRQLVKQLAPLSNAKDKHDHLLRFIRYGTRNSTQVSDPTTCDPTPQASQATIDNVAQTEQLRNKFFSNVCEAANTLLDTAPAPDGLHNRAIFQYCLEPHISLLADQLGAVRDYLCLQKMSSDNKEFLRQKPSIEDKEFLRGIVGENLQLDPRELPIFVAVDKCVHLIRTFTNKKDDEHQLNSLRRAWNYINEREKEYSPGTPQFWLVLLSTNSAATILIDKSKARGSDRAKGKAITPTWMNMGFDLMRCDSEPLPCAGAAANLEHLRSYGRPLWASLPSITFWSDAELKLLSSRASYDDRCFELGELPNEPRMQELHFSILASRLALSFCPAVKGQPDYEGIAQDRLASGSVDRHMRILSSIVDGYRLNITSPSEPVLAITAAFIMMALYEIRAGQNMEARVQERYRRILERFQLGCLPVLNKQNALKGEIGELVARILLMVAWDAAKLKLLKSAQGDGRHQTVPSRAASNDMVRSSAGASSSSTSLPALTQPPLHSQRFQQFHSPLRLQDLLDQVFTLSRQDQRLVDERLNWVCSQLPKVHPPSGTTNGRVELWTNFTHFDEAKYDVRDVSTDFLWYCWKRGAAIQTIHNQFGIDGIIPVFVGDLDHAFAKEKPLHSSVEAFKPAKSAAACHMTYIAWQVKNRNEGVSTSDPMDNLGGPKITTCGPPPITEKGVLTIRMEPDTEAELRQSHSPKKKTKVKKWKPPPPPKGVKGAEEARLGRKRGMEYVDETVRERSLAFHSKRKAVSTKPASPQQKVTTGSTCKEDQTASRSTEYPSGAADRTEAPPPEPTQCQKGFLEVKLRGVLSEDVYPGLTAMKVRDLVATMVGQMVYLMAKTKPVFERDNCMIMPLDIRNPHIAGHIIEGDRSSQGQATSSLSP